jgi:(S)-mandelate dehydrogenase
VWTSIFGYAIRTSDAGTSACSLFNELFGLGFSRRHKERHVVLVAYLDRTASRLGPRNMKRRYYTGRDVSRALSIEELRRMASCRLPAFALEYLESGGEDEVGLRRNRDIFNKLPLVPRYLQDTTARSSTIELLGRQRASPLVIAPTGHNGLFWPEGDTLLAQAAHSAGIPFTLSTLSNTRVEQLAERTSGALWMQLYVFRDRALMADILERAARARCEALVVTVDTNVFGWREWDRRQYRSPGRLSWRSMIDVAAHPTWAKNILLKGLPPLPNVSDFFPPEARTTRGAVMHVPTMFAADITWETVKELRMKWSGKFIIKGLLSVEDAVKAAEIGCDGIVLSNHGARHVDNCISPMEILPTVAKEVGDQVEILVDGGFRRGSDVIKAIALGARAVLLGRATLYGLAAGGEAGVDRALELLTSEIVRTLGQLGCNRMSELSPRFLAEDVGAMSRLPKTIEAAKVLRS